MTSAKKLLKTDPRLAANTVLIVDRLMPRMNDAVRFSGKKYPDSPKEDSAFVAGAIYGIVSSHLHDHSEDVTAHEVGAVAATVCQFLDMLFSAKYEGDLDRLCHDLVPGAFAEGGAA